MRSHLLKPLYNRAADGLPILGTPAETAGRFLSGPGTLAERAEEMSKRFKVHAEEVTALLPMLEKKLDDFSLL